MWDTVESTYVRSLGLERLHIPSGTTTTILGVFSTGGERISGSSSDERVKEFI